MSFIKLRDWDTSFFDKKVGEINDLSKLENFDLINKEIGSFDYKFLLHRHELNSSKLSIPLLGKLGFEYIDTHLTLEFNLSKLKNNNFLSSEEKDDKFTIRLVEKSEIDLIPRLQEIGVELSKVSRFALDEKIPTNLTEKLYEDWIKNGFSGDMADYIFVIFDENNKALGFTYFLEKNEGEFVDLSLLAVDSSIRGLGLGSKLMNFALLELSRKYERCSLVVSMSNPLAVRFYEKLGFRTLNSKLIFHMHRD